MLGPVTISSRRSGTSVTSLGMKCSTCSSTTGWRPPRMRSDASVTNCGRTQRRMLARSARCGHDVERGQGGGRSCSGPMAGSSASTSASNSVFLARQRAFLRGQRLVLERLQFRRDVALGVLERLPPPVVVRNPGGVGMRDLDVEAVHAVVLDLERADAGAFALAPFQLQRGSRRIARRCCAVRRVRRRGPRRSRRRRGPAPQAPVQSPWPAYPPTADRIVSVRRAAPSSGTPAAGLTGVPPARAAHGACRAAPRVRADVRWPARCVPRCARRRWCASAHRAGHGAAGRRQAAPRWRRGARRPLRDPVAAASAIAAACGCRRPSRSGRAANAASARGSPIERGDDLQVATRRRVDVQVGAGADRLDAAHMGQRRLLRGAGVGEQGAGCRDAERHVVHAKRRQVLGAEMAGQRACSADRVELPRGQCMRTTPASEPCAGACALSGSSSSAASSRASAAAASVVGSSVSGRRPEARLSHARPVRLPWS